MPSASTPPRRLSELDARLHADGRFADWQLARKAPLTKVHPDEEAEIVTRAGRALLPIAGDFAGGVLALDMSSGDPERAPVVEFDSEGGITVLGESFDDFLALLASERPDEHEDSWTADEDLRRWILASGITPHASAHSRLVELSETTRRFNAVWHASLRAASCHLFPDVRVEHRLVLGESIGDVTLGMERAELDARWGMPNLPSWSRDETGVTALYPRCPVVVHLDLAERIVVKVTMFASHHGARTDDGVEPMFMPASDALRWLEAAGHAPTRDRLKIRSQDARTELVIERARGARETDGWVSAVTIRT